MKVTALVLSRDAKMSEFLSTEFTRLVAGKSRRGLSAVNGYAMGHAEGKRININKGVEGSTIINKRLL